MPLLQFTPLQSRPSASFWSSLTSLKLDTLKLDDTERDILGFLDEGMLVKDRGAGTSKKKEDEQEGQEEGVWVAGSLGVDERSLGSGSGSASNDVAMKGTFRNFNTIEDFRKVDHKKQLFDETVDRLLASFENGPATFNPFLLVTYADLKKYVYNYWFAFPALVEKPGWEVDDRGMQPWNGDAAELRRLKREVQIEGEAFLHKVVNGNSVVGPVKEWKTFFQDVLEEDRTLVIHDPTSMPSLPGWPLRNILYYLAHYQSVQRLRVICLRGGSGGSTVLDKVYLSSPPASSSTSARPSAVGWEKNVKGALASRTVDLGSTMDPTRLADQAVDLNLKLMKWRVMPDLALDEIAATKCLLLGAGTLGCYVARTLMGWGVRHITFVDSAKVSFSNPVRQPLFEFEDCLGGGKPKAQCAADSLKRIFPGVNSRGVDLMIPMPGHPVAPASEASVRRSVETLENLMDEHDVVYLLMDSRESRWLPTVLGNVKGKIVINAALGFDSYLVMRHGPSPGTSKPEQKRLGCYYCNDIVAPMDSLTDRTLDQMCTVSRPGVAPIASATAVELMVSLIQHSQGIHAPADLAAGSATTAESSGADGSPLGLVPHQLRGFLAQFRTMLIEGPAYDRCTGCSATVVDAYKQDGFAMLLRAFNEDKFLEQLTGLDKLYEEGEAALEQVDWDDSDAESGASI
ncbi:hypothetical protein HD553DRAFT_39955 [Filobasidium floriforme]|uniref:uncharacterized protein n=1 Tax=Filobasidium floriforme TaxID=5210 RepID=UPI001E8E3A80|nr:uncharacterized protein HD553DRAFT_39955 [Filobasidium floriforme]KAH8084102.1 hypothetical protein HD553DRAFT_39955 [Filobasidium floriforme]